MVLVEDLLGAGKVEKVRSGGCDIVSVDCDWVCMMSVRQDEKTKLMELAGSSETQAQPASHAARPRSFHGPSRAACMSLNRKSCNRQVRHFIHEAISFPLLIYTSLWARPLTNQKGQDRQSQSKELALLRRTPRCKRRRNRPCHAFGKGSPPQCIASRDSCSKQHDHHFWQEKEEIG
jgi:hypothetical protein